MNATTLNSSYEAADLPVFLDGMIEGMGMLELSAAKDAVRQVVEDIVKLTAGDLGVFQTIIEDYKVLSESFKSLSLPELD